MLDLVYSPVRRVKAFTLSRFDSCTQHSYVLGSFESRWFSHNFHWDFLLILTIDSIESEIKAYFEAVLKLSKSDNEFPINFDEVWMLAYQDKHKAVNELKDKFIQDVDYQAVARKSRVSKWYRIFKKN